MYTFSTSSKTFATKKCAEEYIARLVKCHRCFDVFENGKLVGTGGFGEFRWLGIAPSRAHNTPLHWSPTVLAEL